MTIRDTSVKYDRLLRDHFRLSKSFTKALRVDLNVFNLFNTNVAFEGNWVSGPTYGFITRIADPRVFRIGARLEF